jgi:hypothetical protein
MLPALAFQVVFYALFAYAQSSFQLGCLPLAVKTPYLNGWVQSDNGSSPERAWPNFYRFDHVRQRIPELCKVLNPVHCRHLDGQGLSASIIRLSIGWGIMPGTTSRIQ